MYKTQVCLIYKPYFPCFKETFNFIKEKETSPDFLGLVLLSSVTESPRYVDLSVFMFSFFPQFYCLYSQISIPFIFANEVYEISILRRNNEILHCNI